MADKGRLAQLGVDDAVLSLSLMALGNEDHKCIVAELSAPSAAADPSQLEPIASLLRSSGQLPAAACKLTDTELARLVHRVRSNLHVSLDDETASRPTGVGLYPEAALINHSCIPSACLSWRQAGRMLQVRAIVDLRAGEEVTCSYLAEQQLYAPFAERASLLREAFGFTPTEPRQRRAAEEATVAETRPSAALLRKAQQLLGATHGAANAASAGTERLASFVDAQLMGCVHPFHWIVQEAHTALLAAARADGNGRAEDPHRVAKCALHLIAAREFTLPVGTLHLAALYAAHGSALCRVHRGCDDDDDELASSQREELAAAAVRSLTAAHRIRCCCLGEDHPLSAMTAAAVQQVGHRGKAKANELSVVRRPSCS